MPVNLCIPKLYENLLPYSSLQKPRILFFQYKMINDKFLKAITNTMSLEKLWEAVRRFKSSRYYADAEWDRVRSMKIKEFVEELIEDFSELDGDRFKEKLRSFLQERLMARVRPIPKEIVENNDPTKLVLALVNLRFSRMSVEERIRKLMELHSVGTFVATELVALFDEDYICYHDNLIEALEDPMIKPVIKYLEMDIPQKVKDADDIEDYLKLNEICKAIRNIFNFRDLWEVHEFLWHGRDTNWRFQVE